MIAKLSIGNQRRKLYNAAAEKIVFYFFSSGFLESRRGGFGKRSRGSENLGVERRMWGWIYMIVGREKESNE